MQQLPQELITKALSLTWKTIDDMQEETSFEDMDEENWWYRTIVESKFSIEKFCFFLLSPEFIEKYMPIFIKEFYIWEYNPDYDTSPVTLSYQYYWEAIWEYQKGNSQPLIDLLSKI